MKNNRKGFILYFLVLMVMAGCNDEMTQMEDAVDDLIKVEVEAAAETDETEEIASTSNVNDETVNENINNEVEEEVHESPYTYSDFVGYYLHFDENDSSHADMIFTVGPQYLTLGWYLSEFELYEVVDSSIEENRLTIEYHIERYGTGEEENGTMTLYLTEENGVKSIDFGTDIPFYNVTYDEVTNYNYDIQDFLIEDINP